MSASPGLKRRTLPLRGLARPDDGVVDVWQVRQDRLPLAGLGMLAATTEGIEGRRMLRMQQRFLLRLLLGAYLDKPGRDVVIERGPAGKPELAGDDAGRLAFSLSHTGPWLAVAISAGEPVGIDIEPADRRPRWQRLARRYFPADEAERLCACGDEGGRRFLAHWTAREALVKAAGRTLAGNVGAIGLAEVEPAGRLTLAALPEDWPEPQHWQLVGLDQDVPDELIGHVAVRGDRRPGLARFELAAPG
ncbi:4'-phosphopantetheinyl transferase superfamily protein [Wenzhouxiangella sp. XN79A]|uniref:4'-phosphopantetheinyl transferase family protein n=1 Tax=Wenzhouxiangella sp. XN79A TaxID=2724193 RepID=UPI00144ABBEE|nr:4'-phosphopantetheinyl transferase superfamily protein [Wenzhouxiangella sp. XN79A]NKI35885.1 4'-phosphopantetheinyl transferase superfamily protein [Wenzhouxiangella sp. XN79A]